MSFTIATIMLLVQPVAGALIVPAHNMSVICPPASSQTEIPCQECCTACKPIGDIMAKFGEDVGLGLQEAAKDYEMQAYQPCLSAGDMTVKGCTAAFAKETERVCLITKWETMNGCCRERVPGAPKRKRYLSHHDSMISKETIDGGTMAEATAVCKQNCEDDETCTAVEVHATKKTKNKNRKKKKKTSKGFACELHTATINSATRRSKSCKKAKCFTLGNSETKKTDTKKTDTKETETKKTDTKQTDTKQTDTKQTYTKTVDPTQTDTKLTGLGSFLAPG